VRATVDIYTCGQTRCAMHLNSNNTTRVAQPPGGRTSFSFSDGSDDRRRAAPGPEAQRTAVAMQQPPGGRTNFEFDDSISRGEGGVRRHTNGLLRRQPTPWGPSEAAMSPQPQAYQQQPPGGRSSFTLNDNSTGAYNSVAPQQQQPPGGRSNFSLGDNSTGAYNLVAPRQPVDGGAYRQPPGGASSFTLNDNSTGAYNGPASYRQPPGGRSSGFSLTDGSNERSAYQQAPPQALPQAPPQASYRQPPGGRSSGFSLTDGSNERSAYRQAPPQALPQDYSRQPAGGRSSGFSLTDSSNGGQPVVTAPRNTQQRDALEEFVETQRSQPQSASSQSSAVGSGHRATLAPPGGHSSFSIGWGGDSTGNHHRHAGRMPARAPDFPYGSALDGGRGGYAGLDATERAKPPPYAPVAMHSGIAAGSIPSVRNSTLVAAPPGGQSSFVFG